MQLSVVLLLMAAAPIDSRGVDELIMTTPGMVTSPTAPTMTSLDSVPVVQRAVTSKLRVEDLKTFFTASFQKMGLYLAPEQDNFKPQTGDQVTGVDTENLISYTVVLQPTNQLTTVIVACANLGKPKMTQSTDAIAPVFPGGHGLSSYRIETTQGMSYSTTATPAEIKSFYREVMGKAGFTASEDIVFTRGHIRLSVTVAVAVGERVVSVFMQTSPDGSSTPEPVPAPLTMLPPATGASSAMKPAAAAKPAPAPAAAKAKPATTP